MGCVAGLDLQEAYRFEWSAKDSTVARTPPTTLGTARTCLLALMAVSKVCARPLGLAVQSKRGRASLSALVDHAPVNSEDRFLSEDLQRDSFTAQFS